MAEIRIESHDDDSVTLTVGSITAHIKGDSWKDANDAAGALGYLVMAAYEASNIRTTLEGCRAYLDDLERSLRSTEHAVRGIVTYRDTIARHASPLAGDPTKESERHHVEHHERENARIEALISWLRTTPRAGGVLLSIGSSQDIARLADDLESGAWRYATTTTVGDAPITFDCGKLPSGWPQPTFMSVSEDGSLNIEWCFGEGADDSWRVIFSWDPDEGAMICRTNKSEQRSLCQAEGNDPKAIGPTLDRWLRPETASPTHRGVDRMSAGSSSAMRAGRRSWRRASARAEDEDRPETAKDEEKKR